MNRTLEAKMELTEQPCAFQGSGIGPHLNRFIADIFGISQVNEDGIPRTLGFATHQCNLAVFWHIAISYSVNVHISLPRTSMYDYTELEACRRSAGDMCYVSYIIHPVPISELCMCKLFKPPKIYLQRDGSELQIHTMDDRYMRIGDSVLVEWHGWRPFGSGNYLSI